MCLVRDPSSQFAPVVSQADKADLAQLIRPAVGVLIEEILDGSWINSVRCFDEGCLHFLPITMTGGQVTPSERVELAESQV